jgi:hypothetical protein
MSELGGDGGKGVADELVAGAFTGERSAGSLNTAAASRCRAGGDHDADVVVMRPQRKFGRRGGSYLLPG